jgi:hypothetical protein
VQNCLTNSSTGGADDTIGWRGAAVVTPAERAGRMRLSMHNGVALWCDCCSCEAEPYWRAVAEQKAMEDGESDGQGFFGRQVID